MVENASSAPHSARQQWRSLGRVVGKAIMLFVVLNIVFALFHPLDALGHLSTYNLLFRGRERLPYGDLRSAEYNVSVDNIPAMIHSHTIAASPTASFNVLVIGDSSIWGWLLDPDETLVADLQAVGVKAGHAVRFYNLGYPVLSATKDLLLLDATLPYQPDLIIWPVTLASLAPEKQLGHPLLQENRARVRALITRYHLAQDGDDPRLHERTFYESTIVGRRRDLSGLLRLQLLAPLWSATGIDQVWPETIQLRQSDFDADLSWASYGQPVTLTDRDLSLDILAAGVKMAGEVPVLVVNEPIYISAGENSALRYNSFYPRWAYDQYRDLLARTASAQGWHYVDLWDLISPEEFTDTPVHLTPTGTTALAARLWSELERQRLLPP